MIRCSHSSIDLRTKKSCVLVFILCISNIQNALSNGATFDASTSTSEHLDSGINVDFEIMDDLDSNLQEVDLNSVTKEGTKLRAQERFWRSQGNISSNQNATNMTENSSSSSSSSSGSSSSASASASASSSSPSIPFVKSIHGNQNNKKYLPPEGFQITARIVSSHEDGLSYFSDPDPSTSTYSLQIPYQECSSVGITTPPINLRHLTFRHLPPAYANNVNVKISGGTPSSKSKTNSNSDMDVAAGPWAETGPTPQLVVCLHPIQITVSGNNEKRIFEPGQVILLEDMHSRGHKMSAVAVSGEDHSVEDDLSVLILTLPHPPKHHKHSNWNNHNKKENESASSTSQKPCNLENNIPYFIPITSTNNPTRDSPSQNMGLAIRNNIRNLFQKVDVRRAALATTGLVSSSALTYFLGKVAPPVLAVIFGGGCVVVGGTCLVVKGGEAVMDQLDEMGNRRRLEQLKSNLS